MLGDNTKVLKTKSFLLVFNPRMIVFMDQLKPGWVQSFGCITKITKNKIFIKHKDTIVELYNVDIECVEGDWLKFYGHNTNNIIVCEFTENLRGKNINILEKAVQSINHNN